MENKDKTAFIHAGINNVKAAAEGLPGVSDEAGFSLANRPGQDSYPICGAIWAVCYQSQPEAQRQRMLDFLQWAIHDGQKAAPTLLYSPLPPAFVAAADAKLKLIHGK